MSIKKDLEFFLVLMWNLYATGSFNNLCLILTDFNDKIDNVSKPGLNCSRKVPRNKNTNGVIKPYWQQQVSLLTETFWSPTLWTQYKMKLWTPTPIKSIGGQFAEVPKADDYRWRQSSPARFSKAGTFRWKWLFGSIIGLMMNRN